MKDTIRVLYLSYDGMTDALGQSQVLAYLKRIASPTVNIDIISFEKPDLYQALASTIEASIKDTDLRWFPLSYTKKPPILSTLKDLRNGWKLIRKLNSEKQYDIVHCRGYITAILGLKMKRKLGVKFIFDMRGWWADEKLESGFWSSSIYKPVYNYFKRLERKFFSESDYTVSLTYSGKKEIVEKQWKEADRVRVVPTCVDFDVFKPFDTSTREKVRLSIGIPAGADVLLYSGSLGGNYGLEEFFRIFKAFDRVNPGSYFIILSKTDPGFINDYIKSVDIDPSKIKILSVGYKEVHKYLMAADLGLIYYMPSYSVIGRCPTKMGEYWACGLPVLSFKGIGDIDNIFEKYPSRGVLAEKLDDQSIVEALQSDKVVKDKFLLREAGFDYFSIDKGVEFYKDLYKRCLSEA